MKNLALHMLSKICPIKNMSHRKSVRRKNVPVPVLLLTHSHRVKTQINPIVIQLYLKSRRRKMGILIRFFVFFVSLDFFDFLPEHRDGLFGQKQLLLQLHDFGLNMRVAGLNPSHHPRLAIVEVSLVLVGSRLKSPGRENDFF